MRNAERTTAVIKKRGGITNEKMFDERHILHYALGFEKAPAMALDVAFRRTGGKITMLDFRILNLGTNTAETATQGKEK